MAPPIEHLHVRFAEAAKWASQVTTLSAGSIVVIATFGEKFHGRGPGWLLAIAVIGFAVTIIAFLIFGFSLVFSIGQPSGWHDATLVFAGGLSLFVGAFFFALALTSLAIFAAIAVT